MNDPFIPVSASPTGGALFTVGYNAWKLTSMITALQDNQVNILVDTRAGNFGRYSYEQLAVACQPDIRFVARPVLTGKPLSPHEYTPAGQADYQAMRQRPGVGTVLDGMAQAIRSGQRIALLCACSDPQTCHRTRWLAEMLYERGLEAGHLEPGSYQDEESVLKWSVTPHREWQGQLPAHSERIWRVAPPENLPIPRNYHSPEATVSLPTYPRVILIAGSMNANPAQLNYATDLVVRAAEIGAQLRVGDNDQGVDARVVATAAALGYTQVQVWTPEPRPRNGGVPGGQVIRCPYQKTLPGNAYTQRDRTMIGSMPSDGACFFLSNGFTHYKSGRMTGTEAGYIFAVEHKLPTRKVNFAHPSHRTVAVKPLPTTYTPDAHKRQHDLERLHAADLDAPE